MVEKSKIPLPPTGRTEPFELPMPSYSKPYRELVAPVIKPTGKKCKE